MKEWVATGDNAKGFFGGFKEDDLLRLQTKVEVEQSDLSEFKKWAAEGNNAKEVLKSFSAEDLSAFGERVDLVLKKWAGHGKNAKKFFSRFGDEDLRNLCSAPHCEEFCL